MPDSGAITIAPQIRSKVSFVIDDASRPSSELSIDTVSSAFHFVYLAPGAGKTASAGEPSHTEETQTLVSSSSVPETQQAALSSSEEVSYVLPGLVRKTGVSTLIPLVNQSTRALHDLKLFHLGEGRSAASAESAEIGSLSPGRSLSLVDPIGMFDARATSGSIHFRSANIGAVSASAIVIQTDDPRGTVRYTLPRVRSDRGAAVGQSITLSGLGRGDGSRLDLILQEVSGAPVSALVELLSPDGVVSGQQVVAMSPFEFLRIDRLATAGIAAARITPAAGSEGRIHAFALLTDPSSHDTTVVADSRRLVGEDVAGSCPPGLEGPARPGGFIGRNCRSRTAESTRQTFRDRFPVRSQAHRRRPVDRVPGGAVSSAPQSRHPGARPVGPRSRM